VGREGGREGSKENSKGDRESGGAGRGEKGSLRRWESGEDNKIGQKIGKTVLKLFYSVNTVPAILKRRLRLPREKACCFTAVLKWCRLLYSLSLSLSLSTAVLKWCRLLYSVFCPDFHEIVFSRAN
jgi:hypothetical protein